MNRRPEVSIITLTAGRQHELLRCIESASSQDCEKLIEHIVINDSSSWVTSHRDQLLDINPRLLILEVDLDARENRFQPFYWPSRSGYLRNLAFSEASGRYIVQLDDDNTIDPNHVSSLLEKLHRRTEKDTVAYSWRRILYSAGEPYLEKRYPWKVSHMLTGDNDAFEGFIYQRLVEQDILSSNTNIMRDKVVSEDGGLVCTLDNNEMMIPRSIMEKYPYRVWFDWQEMLHLFTDDYALVRQLYEAGIDFVSTNQPTLNYFLGGISNR